MLKTKFFMEDTMVGLELAVNDFIKNKLIVNISYSVATCDAGCMHCCCVLYYK